MSITAFERKDTVGYPGEGKVSLGGDDVYVYPERESDNSTGARNEDRKP